MGLGQQNFPGGGIKYCPNFVLSTVLPSSLPFNALPSFPCGDFRVTGQFIGDEWKLENGQESEQFTTKPFKDSVLLL